jgi:branched-subunit amino acid ABC-type transport system permease component
MGGVLKGFIQAVIFMWLGVVVIGQAYMSIMQHSAAFVLILIVLLFRPSGLFGSRRVERV